MKTNRPLNPIVIPVLALFALILFVAPARAQTTATESFINGYNLLLNIATADTVGTTNIYASGYTVTNDYTTYPAVSKYSPTMKTNTSAIADVPLWCNADGSSADINFYAAVTGAGSTNLNTTTFALYTEGMLPTSVGAPPDYQSSMIETNYAANVFSTTLTNNGVAIVSYSTTISAAVIKGQHRLRLVITCPTAAVTNTTILGAGIRGWKPVLAQ